MGTYRLGHLAVYDFETFPAVEPLTEDDIQPLHPLGEVYEVELTFDAATGEVTATSELTGEQRTGTAARKPIQSGEDSPVIAFRCIEEGLDSELLWLFTTMDDEARAQFRAEHNKFALA